MKKIIFFILIFISFLLAASIIVFSLIHPDSNGNRNMGSIAGGLAVITAIIGIISTENLISLQENEFKPNPMFKINFDRDQVIQLSIQNYGKSVAYDIKIIWDSPLKNDKGNNLFYDDVSFGVLLPDESVSQYLGPSNKLFDIVENEYKGKIIYKDTNDKKYCSKFLIDFGKYKNTLSYDNEQVKAYREIQKIPEILKQIANKNK